MSNIRKERILIPKSVTVKCKGWQLHASSKHGEFNISFPAYTHFIFEDNYLRIKAPYLESTLYGTLQRKLKTLIHGLALQYISNLKFVGVGYRASIENNKITLSLGHSHEIFLAVPTSLLVSVFKRNNIKIVGSSFEQVRQFAYKIRSFRRPEPFKGKGVICIGEVVRRKEGKKNKL